MKPRSLPQADPLHKDLVRRVERLQAALERQGLDAMVVYGRSNTFYLTGLRCSLSYLVITPRRAVLLVDGRYIEAAHAAVRHCEVRLFKDVDRDFDRLWRELTPARVGFEGRVPWDVVQRLGRLWPQAQWQEAGGLLDRLRLIKSAYEIKCIQASARLNDQLYARALGAVAAGVTERDLAHLIQDGANRMGAEGLSFESIVAAGAMSSRPHYQPQDSMLEPGQLLLIDMGVVAQGYCSDMTRTVGLGPKKVPAGLRRLYDAVLDAQQAALEAVAPGVACAELDRIARERLKKHRLAQYFTHGLGHGVGIDIHEGPVLNASSADVLRPGMVITIEPGAYRPGLGGVRIEDLVAVTPKGYKVLSRTPKAWRTVALEG